MSSKRILKAKGLSCKCNKSKIEGDRYDRK